MNAACVKRIRKKKMTDQNVFMMVRVINVAKLIGEIFSIKNSKDPFHAEIKVVDAVNQNGVNTILFDIVFLPPNAAPPAPTATPAVVEPNIAATNLPILPLFFAKSC